jgi:hypothetical protein
VKYLYLIAILSFLSLLTSHAVAQFDSSEEYLYKMKKTSVSKDSQDYLCKTYFDENELSVEHVLTIVDRNPQLTSKFAKYFDISNPADFKNSLLAKASEYATIHANTESKNPFAAAEKCGYVLVSDLVAKLKKTDCLEQGRLVDEVTSAQIKISKEINSYDFACVNAYKEMTTAKSQPSSNELKKFAQPNPTPTISNQDAFTGGGQTRGPFSPSLKLGAPTVAPVVDQPALKSSPAQPSSASQDQ